MIKDVRHGGRWQLDGLATILPNHVIRAMQQIKPTVVEGTPNIWIWK